MIDTFLAWAQAFMLQVALAARSGNNPVVPLISLFFFLLILFRGILPLRIPRSAKAICALPVFLGSFNILIYLSLSRLRERPEDLTLPLTVLSFISSVVICWGLLLILRDMLRAVAALSRLIARRCKQNSTAETASPDLSRRRVLVNGGLLLVAGAAGCVGTRNALGSPEIIPTEILCPRLPAALNGLRIVQLSDLHISDILTRAWVRDVVDRVNALRPDLIVVTGDLVDGHPRELMRHVEVLADLRAAYGVHTCTGNHDFYSGLEDWLPRFRELGLGVLRNEHLVLNINDVPLTILGLHDLKESVRGQGPDLKLALAGAPEHSFRILLEHHPQEAPKRATFTDIMLSGHTHGGQLVPLSPLVRRANNGFVAGYYPVGNMRLYVSRGTGVWGGLPLRLGVPAEISLLTLRSAS